MDGKKLILIVDDEHANQFLLEGLLSALGYETITAGNGEECLALLNNHEPNLILLDIMMPKLNGIDTLKKISESEEFKKIPIIMVSAKTSTNDIKQALELGAIDYVKKPFDETELSARIKVGLRLKENEDNLREMIAQRESFVRIVSHDLRSPFTAINGFAELLLSDENLTNDQKESLQYIIDSAEYSLEYFNKLLSWTQLEHSDIKLNRNDHNLSQLINNSFLIFRGKAKEKNISLSHKVDEDLSLNLDGTFFQQVIGNLINNAIKFTSENGEINISCDQKEKLEIVVSDSGVGIPEEITPELLFGQTFRSSTRGTKGEKGTGIGLGICKKIIDAHGFEITFRRKEQGTDFVIMI